MKITVEISYYPLTDNYGNKVLDFISELRKQPDIRLRTNHMSTQVSGELMKVMDAITTTMKNSWSPNCKAPIVMKCFNEELDMEWLKV